MHQHSTSEGIRLGWRMPAYGALAAILISLPLLISSLGDLYFFLITPVLVITGICVLIYAAIRKDFFLAATVPIFLAISAVALLYNFQIRTFTRWFIWSRHYKNDVLEEPSQANGDLKHMEWDGWGWGGQDTTVYLVFDPTNSLAGDAQNDASGKLKGIPCEVSEVRRMDSHWYIVLIETGSWDCTEVP